MIKFRLGNSGQRLVFTDRVLDHFACNRQTAGNPKEAGGQLFALFEDDVIQIVLATGPRPTDKRGPTSYVPDRRAERAEIEYHFARGLHFVGDWHTHPERIPSPSAVDKRNMQDCYRRSIHRLNFFVLVIVGDDIVNLNVSMNLCNAHYCLSLN